MRPERATDLPRSAATATPDTGTRPVDPRERRWQRIRRVAGIVYWLALLAIVVAIGVPTDRFSLTLIILVGLAVPCLGRGWRSYGRVLLDWLPFTLVLVVYDFSRGLADAIGLPLHVADVAAADRAVFGVVPTNWLQEHLLDPGHPHWYDAVTALVYSSHFLATPIIAAILWLKNRRVWIAFISRVLALSLAGLITYALFPAAPPWYAGREGVIDPVIRGAGRGWLWLHLNKAGNLVTEGQAASNEVAAMPSLHTAFATIITIFLLALLKNRLRWLIVVYPFLMAFSLVYNAEHYVVDVVAGVVYAFAVHAAVSWWERRTGREWRPRVLAARAAAARAADDLVPAESVSGADAAPAGPAASAGRSA